MYKQDKNVTGQCANTRLQGMINCIQDKVMYTQAHDALLKLSGALDEFFWQTRLLALTPLGYPTPFEFIRNYAYQHNLQKSKTIEFNGKKHTEEIIDEVFIIFITCKCVGAKEVDWVTSCEDLTYLQVSGGGGEHEWRISEDMENKLQREFRFVDEPVQFEPDGWMLFCVRVGRDPN